MALPTRVNRGQYDPFESAQRDFDHMLSRWMGNRGGDGQQMLAPYGVDVREDQDHIYVEAELPGFRKDDIDITLENQTLVITAERSEEHGEPAPAQGAQGRQGGKSQGGASGAVSGGASRPRGEYLLRERRYSRFQRSFTLPPTVDESSVNARLAEGVLTITLNKREETKPRKIQVS
jgi:HSP20 family protein